MESRTGPKGGGWLISDKNEKQPLYFTFQRFLAQAKAHVAEQKRKTGKTPDTGAFRAWAIAWL